MNYKDQDLRGKSFKGQNLQNADFSGSDLRGADFSYAKLANADFSNSTTGLKTGATVLIVAISFLISALSGVLAAYTTNTVQSMISTGDEKIMIAAYITTALWLIFIVLFVWKGMRTANMILIHAIMLILILGGVFKLTGAGSGIGAVYGALALCLTFLMFIVGTISRAGTGGISSAVLIFIIVSISGSLSGSILGGGIGASVMAIACSIIGKKAIKGSKGFEKIQFIGLKIGTYLGTSFKSADLTNADFRNSLVKNTIFTGAELDGVKWENARKMFILN